jgi:hypothetical protein
VATAIIFDRSSGITTQELTALLRSERFTHVHVLAHGAKLRDDVERYGLQFEDRPIGGADLALALTTAVRPCLPAVVTVAACDSGQQGSVVVPGGSAAHELHTAGVPVVVASQFPISEEASVPFVTTLYEGFLSGEHPLRSLAALRRRLAVQFPDEHAWASVVAYECLPLDFDDQLAEVRYWQMRRALDIALSRLEALVGANEDRVALLQQTGRPFPDDFRSPAPYAYRHARADVDAAMSLLPDSGPWAIEGAGLLAAVRKRTAEVAFWLSIAPDLPIEDKAAHLSQSVKDLRQSLRRYRLVMESMLSGNNAPGRRNVATHWLVGQVLALDVLLGNAADDGLSTILRLTAGLALDLSEPSERAWVYGSLLECALLQLTKTPPPPDSAEEATRAAREIVRLCGPESEQVFSTCRQMQRYLYWWGHPDFIEAITADDRAATADWERPGGVLPTARQIVAILNR